MGRRLIALTLAFATAAAAGIPAAAGACASADCCPLAAVGCAPRSACAAGPLWSVATGCCDRPAPAATGTTEVAALAAAAAAPAPLAAEIERTPEPPALSPTSSRAERARAERRHAVGLFTLLHILLT
jgi:hypothetical protein